MEAVWQWGLVVIAEAQRWRAPLLDALFAAMSFLGDEEFYLLFFALLTCSIDYAVGVRIGVLFLLSVYVNTGLKDLIQHPRPFDLEPTLRIGRGESYGLPSGHAQNAVVVWGSLAAWMRRRWVMWLAVALIVLIGLARVYEGVHFPTDVLGGWLVGLAFLLAALRAAPALARWALGPGLRTLVALAAPVALFLVHPTAGIASPMGALAGLAAGVTYLGGAGRVRTDGTLAARTLRFVLCAAVTVAIYLGLRMVFPGEGSPLYLAFRFVRFALVALWISAGAPLLFARVGLLSLERPVPAGAAA